MLPRLTYLLLSLLLLLQAGGAMLCCQVQQLRVRWEQHEAMERRNKPQQTLVLSAERWRQCRYGKDEVLVNGHMYDVVSMNRRGNEVTLTVVCDEDEGEVLATIKKLLSGNEDDGTPVPDGLLDLLCAAYVAPAMYQITPLSWHWEAHTAVWKCVLSAGQHAPILRPPQSVA